ncbi:phage portal protein [Sporomusa acidovorans]|uniref:Phage portal protein, lambda family n=1 Tax=Sporomusa acidovorans (strain ATCC 49682 / DSM 3132 / Mol) TaxID=1123286 RepID=A0ABZ3J8A7_SPOA4|nr:phage portal protein [Sporomusa acidovorans]OZC16022.1 phage portal protein, lambda family [Sporomusa acidovorans DSM 3132]SDD89367.1 phage portal protein, lambda family [Sporomusa acidovorans]
MAKKRKRQKARLPTTSLLTPQSGAQVIRRILNTGYSESGASYKKGTMAGWRPVRSSPQSDIDMNLPTLRARSADAVMSIPLASSAINTSRTHVVGAGLKLSPKPKYKLLGITSEQAKEWARTTKEEFDLWANSKFCDLLKKNNWYDQQDIVYQCYMIDGDSFAAIKYREPLPGMPYNLRIQIFEASRVCNPGTQSLLGSPWSVTVKNPDNGNRIINGVEINDDGAVVAYWICNRYPYDPTNMEIPKWVRVEAFGQKTGQPNILQICHDERPEEYRGVPYLAPVLEVLKQVGRYTEAELTAAIIKSFFSLFFEENYAGNGNFPLQNVFAPHERVSLNPNDFELGSGTMNVLPPGYKVTTVDTGRSLSTYEAFSNQLIRQIGATLEQPYEVLIKAFNSSYSASRAALLQAWAAFKIRRIWFVRDFCQPCYEAWLTEAIAIGRIKAPGYFTDPLKQKAWANAEWYGPVMGSVDPTKEVEAAALRVKYGFSTREKETAEMTGTNFDENVESLAIEEQTLRDAGLSTGMEVNTGKEGLLEEEQRQQKGGSHF